MSRNVTKGNARMHVVQVGCARLTVPGIPFFLGPVHTSLSERKDEDDLVWK